MDRLISCLSRGLAFAATSLISRPTTVARGEVGTTVVTLAAAENRMPVRIIFRCGLEDRAAPEMKWRALIYFLKKDSRFRMVYGGSLLIRVFWSYRRIGVPSRSSGGAILDTTVRGKLYRYPIGMMSCPVESNNRSNKLGALGDGSYVAT